MKDRGLNIQLGSKFAKINIEGIAKREECRSSQNHSAIEQQKITKKKGVEKTSKGLGKWGQGNFGEDLLSHK